MKNKFALILATTFLVLAVLGCSRINPLSSEKPPEPSPSVQRSNNNQTTTDRAVDTVVGDEKIGVPECDEVMDMLTAEANNPDDNYIVKAGKAFVFNKIKQSLKESIEKNKGNNVELAKNCRDAKVQLEKAKAEQDAKSRK